MSAGMLRTHVDRHGLGPQLGTAGCGALTFEFGIQHGTLRLLFLLRPAACRLHVGHELLFRDLQRLVSLHRSLDLDWVVLAERETFPVVGHEDPPKVRMATEMYAEKVEDLAFCPVRRRPDGTQRRHNRI